MSSLNRYFQTPKSIRDFSAFKRKPGRRPHLGLMKVYSSGAEVPVIDALNIVDETNDSGRQKLDELATKLVKHAR